MRRRGFLALPFVALVARAVAKVKVLIRRKAIYVGMPGERCTTLREAFDEIDPGGTIYLVPGYSETFKDPLVIDKDGLTIVGLGIGEERAVFRG